MFVVSILTRDAFVSFLQMCEHRYCFFSVEVKMYRLTHYLDDTALCLCNRSNQSVKPCFILMVI